MIHSEIKQLSCQTCPYRTNDQSNLSSHVKRHRSSHPNLIQAYNQVGNEKTESRQVFHSEKKEAKEQNKEEENPDSKSEYLHDPLHKKEQEGIGIRNTSPGEEQDGDKKYFDCQREFHLIPLLSKKHEDVEEEPNIGAANIYGGNFKKRNNGEQCREYEERESAFHLQSEKSGRQALTAGIPEVSSDAVSSSSAGFSTCGVSPNMQNRASSARKEAYSTRQVGKLNYYGASYDKFDMNFMNFLQENNFKDAYPEHQIGSARITKCSAFPSQFNNAAHKQDRDSQQQLRPESHQAQPEQFTESHRSKHKPLLLPHMKKCKERKMERNSNRSNLMSKIFRGWQHYSSR